ncbi:hypothetical protein [Nocardioides marmotae]|uniref:Uncharacterized protein n=1 Tax=Nocardioides marmotae TaxID=2663857 RepID=A0A6I3JE90_9ACTN|nr:hypothetical protein [Nocardioides marmotae]MCR6032777.1 hypothetical protein [Gordonia jinghuaiqii]MBC9735268.1 hypothetical protein [Nocardioides marmotae]MTB86368.1 hypothetical protein [Nocardioides marmotae]MTB96427.1 hypothetical protein [Nocardioides marmotae]QKE02046.1 hypothetical protein HPC71_13890 [Nocardioides marmotae]
MSNRVLLTVGVLVAIAVASAAVWYFIFAEEHETSAQEDCSDAIARLSVGDDDRNDGLEVDYELTSTGAEQIWIITIDRDGDSLFEGNRTVDEDGELGVEVTTPDRDGGRFTATATPASGGAECTVTLTH